LQHALPTTLGLKAAGWLDSVRFARAQFASAAAQAAQLQFGGAAGTLASLEGRGLEVSRALALELELPEAVLPWHARRERIAALGGAIAVAVGVLGKIAGDLLLMMQTEAGEAFEPAAPGKGGSSAMPHKRNPVGLIAMSAAARRAPGLAATLFAAMPQEHERGAGGWHAEWEVLPELFRLLGGAASHGAEIVAGLELDVEKMRANLDLTRGLLFGEGVVLALAPTLGKARAQALLEAASKTAVAQRRSLAEVLRETPEAAAVLTDDQWRGLFDPAQRLGSAEELVSRALEVK
jgi:3-carboxy-cis,cis-muconate cycloisomerase